MRPCSSGVSIAYDRATSDFQRPNFFRCSGDTPAARAADAAPARTDHGRTRSSPGAIGGFPNSATRSRRNAAVPAWHPKTNDSAPGSPIRAIHARTLRMTGGALNIRGIGAVNLALRKPPRAFPYLKITVMNGDSGRLSSAKSMSWPLNKVSPPRQKAKNPMASATARRRESCVPISMASSTRAARSDTGTGVLRTESGSSVALNARSTPVTSGPCN